MNAAASAAARTWRDLVLGDIRDFASPGHVDHWSPGLETAPRHELRRLQSRRVAAAYRYLWHKSPFYRRKFEAARLDGEAVNGIGDLDKVPLTFREEWLVDQESSPPWGTFSPLSEDDWLERGWLVFTTSGTTARRPRAFRHTTFDRDIWSWLGARALYAMGVRRGDIAINCFGYGTSVAFWGLHYALNHMGVPVIAGGGANSERRSHLIVSCRPTVLLCTPSYALYLGRTMEELHVPPQESSIRLIVTAGEPGACVPGTKRRIEALWNAEVHDDFGCTEVAMTPLGYTCSHQVRQAGHPIGVHLMEDAYVSEVLDPDTFEPVPEGQPGILVVSNLFSEAQPILRYVMGDWAAVTSDPCPCGRSHARVIGGLQGRSDAALKVRGLLFLPAALEDAVRSLPYAGDEFLIEITDHDGLDRLQVVIEPRSGDGAGPQDDLAARARRQLKGVLGIDAAVRVVAHGSLPRTEFKAQRIVDHRKTPALTASRAGVSRPSAGSHAGVTTPHA